MPARGALILAIENASRRRSRRQNRTPPAIAAKHASRPRSPNPHSSRPNKTAPYLPAVSSLGGFRTPAPHRARPSRKGPASETLHLSRLTAQLRERSARCTKAVIPSGQQDRQAQAETATTSRSNGGEERTPSHASCTITASLRWRTLCRRSLTPSTVGATGSKSNSRLRKRHLLLGGRVQNHGMPDRTRP